MNRCDGIIYIASFERKLERDVDWASIDCCFVSIHRVYTPFFPLSSINKSKRNIFNKAFNRNSVPL